MTSTARPDNVPSRGGVPDTEFAERRVRALDAARRRGLDGLIVFSRGGTSLEHYANTFYLAGAHSPCGSLPDTALWRDHSLSAVLLDTVDGSATLIINGGDLTTDALPIESARNTASVIPALAHVLSAKRLNHDRLGIDGSEVLSLKSHRHLVSALGGVIGFLDARHTRYWGNVGVPNVNRTRRLEGGDMFHADFFGAVGGYYADLARGAVVGGGATDEQCAVHESGVELIEDVLLPLLGPVRPVPSSTRPHHTGCRPAVSPTKASIFGRISEGGNLRVLLSRPATRCQG